MSTCAVCDSKFESERYEARARYCSAACKQKAYRARRTGGTDAQARAASNARTRAWRAANPERAREINRQWVERNREKTRENARRFAARNPGYGRANTLRRVYGLTVARYDAMLEAQGGLCAACGRPETSFHQSGTLRRLAVDHDHETGAVRGLLCHHCNIGVGHFSDDPERLEGAARYLRNCS